MKTCAKCNQHLSDECFAWKIKDISRQSCCKGCHKKYTAKHYQDNMDVYKARAKTHRPAMKHRRRMFVIDYLLQHPCTDCGNKDIRVLQFDHRVLVGNAGRRVVGSGSLRRMKEEMALCDVRCANCHMIRTGQQLNWFRATFQQ